MYNAIALSSGRISWLYQTIIRGILKTVENGSGVYSTTAKFTEESVLERFSDIVMTI